MATVVFALGWLLVLAGMVVAIIGGALTVFVPQLIAGGLLLVIGLAIERWRYKQISHQPPKPGWTDTGERFVDPETNQLIAVYLDKTNSDRHYLAVGQPSARKTPPRKNTMTDTPK